MTISTVHVRNDYPNVGATLVLPYTFKVFASSDLIVIDTNETSGVETTLTLTTDYTVSGVGSDGGGNVTLLAARGTGHKVSIISKLDRTSSGVGLPITQATDLVNETGFFQDRIEDRLDRTTRMVQCLVEESGRAMTLPVSEAGTTTTTTLPTLAARKGNVLGFDASTGAPIAVQPAGAPVAAAMQPIVASATVQAGLDLLAGGVTKDAVLMGDGTDIKLRNRSDMGIVARDVAGIEFAPNGPLPASLPSRPIAGSSFGGFPTGAAGDLTPHLNFYNTQG